VKEDSRRAILTKLGAGAAFAAIALAAKPAAALMPGLPLMEVGGGTLSIHHGSPKPGSWLRLVVSHSGGALSVGSVTTVPSQPSDVGWVGDTLVLGVKISAGQVDILGLGALDSHGFPAMGFGDEASPLVAAAGRCAVGRMK
jgi:hypothetical protein